MKIKTCTKECFCVIGKEGSTKDGPGFIQRLWEDANGHFNEVAPLAKKDADGKLAGIWGAMSDFSRSFQPWENQFTQGLYLAGVECNYDALPPAGWTKWVIPSHEYIFVEANEPDIFQKVITYINENQMKLAGAENDFTCPETGKCYMFSDKKSIENSIQPEK